MTIFIVVVVLATAAALAAVLVPLLRQPRAVPAAERDAANLAILKAQLAELDADHARGAIGDTLYVEAKSELERRALEDVAGEGPTMQASPAPGGAAATAGSSSPAPGGSAATAGTPAPGRAAATGPGASRRHVHATAIALLVTVPLAAALIYLQLGTPGVLTGRMVVAGAAPHEQAPDGGAGQPPVTREQIEQMVAQLAERMKNEPDNAEGWAMLGRSYYMMQRFDDAVRAYAALAKLRPQDPDALADYADALAMSRGRTLAGEPLALVRQALALNPRHLKSLAMAGSEAFERGDYNAAVDFWTRLRAELPPNVEIARNIDASIEDARARAAGAAPGAAKAPAAGKKDEAPAGQAAAASIAGRVALSPQLQQRAQATDTVFVIARAAQGPRMPLAVMRLQVKDLPAAFVLDDAMAMTPAMKLSSFPEVVVVARVSKSGAPTPASGDLEGASAAVRLGARDVAVTIDRVLP